MDKPGCTPPGTLVRIPRKGFKLMGTGKVAEAREPRNIAINNALDALAEKINRLLYLKQHIETGSNPEGQPGPETEKDISLSLATTLEQTPDMIRNCINRIDGLVSEIRELLF